MPKPSVGKWDAILPSLKKLEPEDQTYQHRVNEFKLTVTDRQALTLAEVYVHLRQEKDRVKKILSDIDLKITAYEQLLAFSQEARGVGWGLYGMKENAIRLSTGTTIRVQSEPAGQVKDKEAFRQWCIATGYEREMHLMWQSMNTIVKERLFAGEALPDGCDALAIMKIFLTKGDE